MFSGFLQAGAYTGLNGVHGLAGWRCISNQSCQHLHYAKPLLQGFSLLTGLSPYLLPSLGSWLCRVRLFSYTTGSAAKAWTDLPSNTKPSIFYTQKQIEIAQKRMEEIGRKPPSHFTREKVKGFFKTWHIYFLVPRKSYPHHRSVNYMLIAVSCESIHSRRL